MSDEEKRKPVLSDHKRIGKKLVPPFLQIGSLQLTSWMDTGLPESIWLAVLHETIGHAAGVKVALRLCEAALKAETGTYAFTSDFEELSDANWATIRQDLSAKELATLQRGLTRFLRLYPDCPLKHLSDTAIGDPDKDDIEWMKALLSKLFDKGGRAATLALATVVYVQMGQGRLLVHPGSALLQLNEIESYPDTPESRRVGSVVRATVNSFAGRSASPVWPRYFWSRGFELEPCYFAEDEDDEQQA